MARLTLLGLQSRFGDNWGQITWNLSCMSPKRDWSSKGVKNALGAFFFYRTFMDRTPVVVRVLYLVLVWN